MGSMELILGMEWILGMESILGKNIGARQVGVPFGGIRDGIDFGDEYERENYSWDPNMGFLQDSNSVRRGIKERSPHKVWDPYRIQILAGEASKKGALIRYGTLIGFKFCSGEALKKGALIRYGTLIGFKFCSGEA
jgi:hypothetical protein